MSETLPRAVRRHWRNIRNIVKDIDEYTDERGNVYRGAAVEAHLDAKNAAAGPFKSAWLERLFQRLEKWADQ